MTNNIIISYNDDGNHGIYYHNDHEQMLRFIRVIKDELNSNESPGNKMNPQPDQEIEFQNNQKDDGLFDEKQEPVIEESEPKKGEGNE
jgi:hypothetical protein